MVHVKDRLDESSTTGAAAQRIRRAAIALFRARGFHGTSIRDLANAVEMESASLYYHFDSKQAILADLFDQVMDAMIDGVEVAIAPQSGAADRLRAAVLFHVHFHITHQDEAFVSHSELRALTSPHREAVGAKRDRYERLFRDLLEQGNAQGVFCVDDTKLVAIALLMMCSGVSDWFGPHGRLSADKVAQQYVDMVWRLVGASTSSRA